MWTIVRLIEILQNKTNYFNTICRKIILAVKFYAQAHNNKLKHKIVKY